MQANVGTSKDGHDCQLADGGWRMANGGHFIMSAMHEVMKNDSLSINIIRRSQSRTATTTTTTTRLSTSATASTAGVTFPTTAATATTTTTVATITETCSGNDEHKLRQDRQDFNKDIGQATATATAATLPSGRTGQTDRCRTMRPMADAVWTNDSRHNPVSSCPDMLPAHSTRRQGKTSK
ncbi:hypothetical protein ACLKA7_004395 [Drosophila subpalustris]